VRCKKSGWQPAALDNEALASFCYCFIADPVALLSRGGCPGNVVKFLTKKASKSMKHLLY
jgi:hypothetical protein